MNENELQRLLGSVGKFQTVSREDAADVVVFLGRVAAEDIQSWVAASTALLQNSLAEGWGIDISKALKVFEDGNVKYLWRIVIPAGSYGLPVEEMSIVLRQLQAPQTQTAGVPLPQEGPMQLPPGFHVFMPKLMPTPTR